jgi:hypothetical protein
VGPYREAAENVEAGLEALEVAAFKAALGRRGRHVRAAVYAMALTGLAALAVVFFCAAFPVKVSRGQVGSMIVD